MLYRLKNILSQVKTVQNSSLPGMIKYVILEDQIIYNYDIYTTICIDINDNIPKVTIAIKNKKKTLHRIKINDDNDWNNNTSYITIIQDCLYLIEKACVHEVCAHKDIDTVICNYISDYI